MRSPIRSRFQIRYLSIPQWSSGGHRYFFHGAKKGVDIFRRFTIYFSYWNKSWLKFKPNDVGGAHGAHIFIEAVRLHHKSPGSQDWQHHGGPRENCPNTQIRNRYLKECCHVEFLSVSSWKMKDSQWCERENNTVSSCPTLMAGLVITCSICSYGKKKKKARYVQHNNILKLCENPLAAF